MYHFINQYKNPLLILGIILHFISYFIPFLDASVGWRFFKGGVESFNRGNFIKNWYLYYAFFVPPISVPWLLKTIIQRSVPTSYKVVHYCLLSAVVIVPVGISLGLVLYDYERVFEDTILGYIGWVLSFVIFGTLFIHRFKNKEEDDNLSKHLVE